MGLGMVRTTCLSLDFVDKLFEFFGWDPEYVAQRGLFLVWVMVLGAFQLVDSLEMLQQENLVGFQLFAERAF